jgi:hypothetical protein
MHDACCPSNFICTSPFQCLWPSPSSQAIVVFKTKKLPLTDVGHGQISLHRQPPFEDGACIHDQSPTIGVPKPTLKLHGGRMC